MIIIDSSNICCYHLSIFVPQNLISQTRGDARHKSFFQISSVKHVGPTLTSAFNAFLPVFAVIPAVLFLDETVTVVQIFGIFTPILSMLPGMPTFTLYAICRVNGWAQIWGQPRKHEDLRHDGQRGTHLGLQQRRQV